MAHLDSGAMVTAVRRGGLMGPDRGLRRARVVAEVPPAIESEIESAPDSREQPTQPYAVMTMPKATTLLTTTRTTRVLAEESEGAGGAIRFLLLGLALGVILAFLLSGHNLVRLRTWLGFAILPASALQQLQQQPQTVTDANGGPVMPTYATTAPAQAVRAPSQPTPFQPVRQAATAQVGPAFLIPEVDVAHLPKHNPAPRQTPRSRSGGPKAPPSEETAAPFDARTIEASLRE